MMACLSTEPAGAPGRLSGKSCGNWLFCRSSRISSKLSSSLPGCKQRKHGTRCCLPAVGVLLMPCCTCTGFRCSPQEAQCKAHKVVKKGQCSLPWAHLACSWRALALQALLAPLQDLGRGTYKEPHDTYLTPKGTRRLLVMISAGSTCNLAVKEIPQ